MTPNELLKDVTARFTVLLLDEPDKLESLLKQSLRRYQGKAGATGSLEISEEAAKKKGVEVPPFYLQTISVHDSHYDYQNSRIDGDGFLNVVPVCGSKGKPPYQVKFVLDLTRLPLNAGHLPPESVGLIEQHLYHLIELQNNERLRQTNQAARLPTDHIPVASETQGKIDALEMAMEEEGGFLPTAYISGNLE